MIVQIPYGKSSQELKIQSQMDVELLKSRVHEKQPENNQDTIVLAAMKNPAGSLPLKALAAGKNSAVIICSDHTRPVPSKKIIPHMLKELREGNPNIEITLLIATGFHRISLKQELEEKFGSEIMREERIIVHDSGDGANMADIGVLPSGAPLVINKRAVECDLLLAEGFIEPHFFAGYSGGRKSVLPGICARKTVLGNHCAAFIDSPYARTGILENNPIHIDMAAAAQMAGLQYIVNVVINAEKEVIAAFAGHPRYAHEEGCAYLNTLCSVVPSRKGDIVITSNGGYPLDQNIYQAVKCMTAAEAACREGGTIIASAECIDGTGSEDFYQALKNCSSPEALLCEILKIPMEATAPDQWETQVLARVLSKHRVVLVCDEKIRDYARRMKLKTADSLQSAYEEAVAAHGAKAKITIIPDGVSVIVKN